MPDRVLVIRGVTLIDGTGAPPQPDATIVIRGQRFAAVGQRVAVPEGAEVIEARGRWAIPGLVDMHVHIALTGEEALPLWLANGVTTVRDFGPLERIVPLRDQVRAGARIGPRIFAYGPLLDGERANARGAGDGPAIFRIVRDEAEGEALVHALIEGGADGFKLYANLPEPIVRHMIACVDGRVPVTGHLGRTHPTKALEAGINGLEHVFLTVYQAVARPEDCPPEGEGNLMARPNGWEEGHWAWANADFTLPHVQRFIERAVAQEFFLVPTFDLLSGNLGTREANRDPALAYLTPTQRERRRSRAVPQRPPPPPDLLARSLEKQREFLRRYYEAGGRLVAGTDVGAVFPLVPGFSLHHELFLLASAGIPADKVLECATRVAAEALRRSHELGTVTPGKLADLVVLQADPLRDIRNTRRIEFVVKEGVAYRPAELLPAPQPVDDL